MFVSDVLSASVSIINVSASLLGTVPVVIASRYSYVVTIVSVILPLFPDVVCADDCSDASSTTQALKELNGMPPGKLAFVT